MRHFVFLVSLIALIGCETTPTAPLASNQPAEMPTYGELVSKHNNRVQGIKRFWAKTVIELRWADANGSRKFEQGDGLLILDPPLRSVMTIGKLGQVRLWAGSNDTYFWLFDELDADGPKKLYLGRHDGAPDASLKGPAQRSPLPIRVVDLPKLLGIASIAPIQAGAPMPAVRWEESTFVIEPPGEPIRYYFHPITYNVVRVDLLDARGATSLFARLGDPQRIEAEKAAIGPFLNTRIEVITPGQEGDMKLFLSEMTDAERKVNQRAFDLDSLRESRQPEVVIPIRSR